jgi:chromosome segregation ATPase
LVSLDTRRLGSDDRGDANREGARRELLMSLIENRLQLRRRQCEERRQYLAELERLATRLRADAGRLEDEIERAVALGNRISAPPLTERHAKVERSLAAIEAQLGSAAAALAAAEQELRQYERAFATRAGSARLADRPLARRPRGRLPASPAIGGDRGR